MDEIDRVLTRGAERGAARGADAVWAAAVALLEADADAGMPVGDARRAASPGAKEPVPEVRLVDTGTRRPTRLLTAVAAVVVLVAGLVRWSTGRVGDSVPIVTAGSASPADTTGAADMAASATAGFDPFTPATLGPLTEPATTIGVFGDATALMTGIGLQTWGFTTEAATVVGNTKLGCPLLFRGDVDYPDVTGRLARLPVRDGCDWSTNWPAFLDQHPVDLAVLQFGPFDVADHRLPGDDTWRHVGDPVYDDAVRTALRDATALFTARGVRVAWLAAPHVDLGRMHVPPLPDPLPLSDPARIDRFNALVREVTTADPMVTVVDLPGYLATHRPVLGPVGADWQPDGVHFSPESAGELAEWLGPELLSILGVTVAPRSSGGPAGR